MIEQKNADIAEAIEEKFTRCPRCRHYSVRQTGDLSFKEKIKSRFVPITAYGCDHCSHRFVEEGERPPGVRGFWAAMVGRFWPGYLLAVILLVVAAVILAVSAPGRKATDLQTAKEKKNAPVERKQIVQPVKDRPEEKKTREKPADQPLPKEEKAEPVSEIILGNSNRFGVNWSVVKDGVQITRMSNGPLKQAGLKVGDIFSEVDNKKVTDGNYLLRVRNQVFIGQRTEVPVKVFRDGKSYLYKLIKNKQSQKPHP